MANNRAFVTRATGSQGLAVTKHLLAAGYHIHTILPDPNDARSSSYQALSHTNIKIFPGDLDDTAQVDAALAECNALFLNLMLNVMQADGEAQQGERILKSAMKAGVKHVVHSTVLGLDAYDEATLAKTPAAAAVFGGKIKVEAIVRQYGFDAWTILRPG
jgi:uncharacterized protein YbjT (DUF2867 family)